MADGYLNKCRECQKQDVRNIYLKNVVDPEWKQKERARGREKMRKARKEGRCKNPSLEENALRSRKYKEKYPEKYAARLAAQSIPLQPCEVCGSTENIEKHHKDYSRPKDITFLCRKHHYERHIEIRNQQLLNASREKN